jgi:hypothetical protein
MRGCRHGPIIQRVTHVEHSNLTARELFEALKSGPPRKRFGFGKRPALINVDVQHAYTRPDEFPPLMRRIRGRSNTSTGWRN